MSNRFWVVLRDHSPATGLSCTVRHESRDSAKAEALRLASKHPGFAFFVAAVTGVAEFPIQTPSWTELKKADYDA